MFNELQITLTGGCTVVTIAMWLLWIVVGVVWLYQTRLFNPLRKFITSLKILIKPRKQRSYYINLYKNGYIYKWCQDLCLKKWNKGL